jgi:hypothetical protein
MNPSAALIRWRPALIALVLGLAALLRAMPPPAQAQGLDGSGLRIDAHELCIGLASSADAPGPAVPIHEACGACCLLAGRVAVALPAVLPLAPEVPLPQSGSGLVAWPGLTARAPPHEAWSQERAQRGPPARLVA